MPKLLRMACNVHCQIVLATIAPVGILEFVDAIAGVINAVAFPKQVNLAIERKAKRSAFYGDILAGAGIMRQECTGVHARRQRRSHEFKLHLGQHRRENAALPAGRIYGYVLFAGAQKNDSPFAFQGQQAGDGGAEPGGDLIEDENRRSFFGPFDRGKHGAADARLLGQLLEREVPACPFVPDAFPKFR